MKLLYFIIAIGFMACSETSLRSPKEFIYDLKYGKYQENCLDLYLPEGRSGKTPVIIFIHGGAWVHGDKGKFTRKFVEKMAENDWIVANLNYRLVNDSVSCKDIMIDVHNAISFLIANAKKFNIQQKKVILIGHSAGGHISLLYAYKEDSLNQVQMVVSYAGPTNLNDVTMKLYADSVWDMPYLYPQLLGEKFELNGKAAIDCSPLYFVKPVPTLLVHGDADPVVPLQQALQLNDSLAFKKVKHLLIVLPDGKHSIPQGIYNDSVNAVIKNWLNAQ